MYEGFTSVRKEKVRGELNYAAHSTDLLKTVVPVLLISNIHLLKSNFRKFSEICFRKCSYYMKVMFEI